MTDEQAIWLQKADFEELMMFIKSSEHEEFWEDHENSRMFFARFHDVIEEETRKHGEAMLNWGFEPLEATQLSAGVK